MHSLGGSNFIISEKNEGIFVLGLLFEILQVVIKFVLLETAVVVAVEIIVDLVEFSQSFLGNWHPILSMIINSLLF